jgi:hypothetical protein
MKLAGVSNLYLWIMLLDFVSVAQQCFYFFFFTFVSVLSKFSLTLNDTILLIKSKGIDLSKGNIIEPFAP